MLAMSVALVVLVLLKACSYPMTMLEIVQQDDIHNTFEIDYVVELMRFGLQDSVFWTN